MRAHQSSFKTTILAVLAITIAGDTITVNSRGLVQRQTINVTFVNELQGSECNLYWTDQSGNGPRLFYGPLQPAGGRRTIEALEGSTFMLTTAGTLEPLAEYTVRQTSRIVLTEADMVLALQARDAEASVQREATATACRQLVTCHRCIETPACGWSVVRHSCYAAHPIATADEADECAELSANTSRSIDAWLNQATALVLGREGHNARVLRDAYRVLERAAEVAAEAATTATEEASVKAARVAAGQVSSALAELAAKLEAVFDDFDAHELLERSRSAALSAIHPKMAMVPRRSLTEAKAYIARGEPVVVVDAATHADARTSPLTHKWTLEYLSRRVFSSTGATGATGSREQAAAAPLSFNVAADNAGRCCRYFEPRKASDRAGHPYPFAPTTHLYRDHFDGFVKTVRRAARGSAAAASGGQGRVLHYLHEIVMNRRGEAVVAGGPAPAILAADLAAISAGLSPLAARQPFFGGFGAAKLWLGQRGVVMPLHYDATDNLYMMAWGRKRAILAPPGQLEELYRFPNAHPLAGSSQARLRTSPHTRASAQARPQGTAHTRPPPGDVTMPPRRSPRTPTASASHTLPRIHPSHPPTTPPSVTWRR